jgi:hypothetical protein
MDRQAFGQHRFAGRFRSENRDPLQEMGACRRRDKVPVLERRVPDLPPRYGHDPTVRIDRQMHRVHLRRHPFAIGLGGKEDVEALGRLALQQGPPDRPKVGMLLRRLGNLVGDMDHPAIIHSKRSRPGIGSRSIEQTSTISSST